MTQHDSDTVADIHRELHSHLPAEPALRLKAMESLLVEKGLVQQEAIDAFIQIFAEQVGPRRGAEAVARAWTDPDFKARLLDDATGALSEAEFGGMGGGHLKAIENTESVHNLVVCTLCSCYPISVLGIPPAWYKEAAYRSRAVREPRALLKEFGVEIEHDVQIKVWDSTAELRYLVVPQRPAGTDNWSAAQLAELVTRNSMIGTDRNLAP